METGSKYSVIIMRTYPFSYILCVRMRTIVRHNVRSNLENITRPLTRDKVFHFVFELLHPKLA